jgi:hypothetical protein
MSDVLTPSFHRNYMVSLCPFFVIVTAVNEYSSLRNMTNNLQEQSLLSLPNTPLHSKQYNTSGSFHRRSESTIKQIHLQNQPYMH